jgi:hypothetical protein
MHPDPLYFSPEAVTIRFQWELNETSIIWLTDRLEAALEYYGYREIRIIFSLASDGGESAGNSTALLGLLNWVEAYRVEVGDFDIHTHASGDLPVIESLAVFLVGNGERSAVPHSVLMNGTLRDSSPHKRIGFAMADDDNGADFSSPFDLVAHRLSEKMSPGQAQHAKQLLTNGPLGSMDALRAGLLDRVGLAEHHNSPAQRRSR